ncbi:acetate/propionate family kinase [Allomuricauda sp. SCSIO 65647]|uniref:acetate/propionate family kinase n=1 Tax=Allomuricauda sp. SCSIO 65647 TaxID=2908843 RepID=UPI001F34200E|nr:acetate kinase [Muricauda sp. SCSIO 65647]UJH66370.1 acetate kinase [Muricauda sp. SCSIO 65647]
MNILIINSGSSSIKFQLIAMPDEKVICSGTVERIGSEDSMLHYKTDTAAIREKCTVPSHREGLQKIADILLYPENGALKKSGEIDAVGHRVVHGGDSFAQTAMVTEAVKEKINEFSALAPLHNPHNLEGILITEQLFPKAKQIAVFDTAFHQTIPLKARKYAIPNEFYDEHGIQSYGFHGTSHKYVSEKAIAYLKKEKSKIITIHLGNGCSMTAVVDGKSVDHSLGFAPSNGLIMGSRSGDIDHSIIFHLADNLGYTLDEVNTLLTKKSGMLGLTGFSDLRDIEAEAEKGNVACQMALGMNAYRIKKYIGAYIAAMNGLDAIVFTAGIGENSSRMRKRICADMGYLGLQLDDLKNETWSSSLPEINTDTSKVKILVMATNEELEIAKQVYQLQSR